VIKVYLAGSWRERKKIKKWMKLLEKHGSEITIDWTWHDSEDAEDVLKFARDDKLGVEACDVFIIDAKFRTLGKYVELGMALALNKEIYMLGNSTCIFSNLIDHKNKFDDINELIKHIRGE